YTLAAGLYDSLIRNGHEYPEIYYNLGNCYFKLNQLGKSIWCYEKALKYDPDDEDILYNLKLANSRQADRILTIPELKIVSWWKRFVRMFSSTGWAFGAVLFSWLALGAFSLFLFTSLKKTGLSFGITFLFISFLALFMRSKALAIEKNPSTGILIEATAYIKSAPGKNSANLFIIHEGLKVQLKDQVAGWYKIRLSDGKVGWVEKEKIAVI
ncbi:MAG: tetratricopeptide repeat protein, partial [Chitinophagales bacterium]|nr:tetratricopeptide repeat protein [Chitinophagales bacterium]